MTRYWPAYEPGPQTPLTLLKLFFLFVCFSLRVLSQFCSGCQGKCKGHRLKWTNVIISELYSYIGLIFYMDWYSTWTWWRCSDWKQGSSFLQKHQTSWKCQVCDVHLYVRTWFVSRYENQNVPLTFIYICFILLTIL